MIYLHTRFSYYRSAHVKTRSRLHCRMNRGVHTSLICYTNELLMSRQHQDYTADIIHKMNLLYE
ncbi:hypothetical protein BDB01DRAFT_303934 [Pilobolus umbonatus]|nr:hypothetical protein BDB01DRAFT_303934 [Pilobolus umbonatus]